MVEQEIVEFAEKVERLCKVLVGGIAADNDARRRLQDLMEQAADIQTSGIQVDESMMTYIAEALR